MRRRHQGVVLAALALSCVCAVVADPLDDKLSSLESSLKSLKSESSGSGLPSFPLVPPRPQSLKLPPAETATTTVPVEQLQNYLKQTKRSESVTSILKPPRSESAKPAQASSSAASLFSSSPSAAPSGSSSFRRETVEERLANGCLKRTVIEQRVDALGNPTKDSHETIDCHNTTESSGSEHSKTIAGLTNLIRNLDSKSALPSGTQADVSSETNSNGLVTPSLANSGVLDANSPIVAEAVDATPGRKATDGVRFSASSQDSLMQHILQSEDLNDEFERKSHEDNNWVSPLEVESDQIPGRYRHSERLVHPLSPSQAASGSVHITSTPMLYKEPIVLAEQMSTSSMRFKEVPPAQAPQQQQQPNAAPVTAQAVPAPAQGQPTAAQAVPAAQPPQQAASAPAQTPSQTTQQAPKAAEQPKPAEAKAPAAAPAQQQKPADQPKVESKPTAPQQSVGSQQPKAAEQPKQENKATAPVPQQVVAPLTQQAAAQSAPQTQPKSAEQPKTVPAASTAQPPKPAEQPKAQEVKAPAQAAAAPQQQAKAAEQPKAQEKAAVPQQTAAPQAKAAEQPKPQDKSVQQAAPQTQAKAAEQPKQQEAKSAPAASAPAPVQQPKAAEQPKQQEAKSAAPAPVAATAAVPAKAAEQPKVESKQTQQTKLAQSTPAAASLPNNNKQAESKAAAPAPQAPAAAQVAQQPAAASAQQSKPTVATQKPAEPAKQPVVSPAQQQKPQAVPQTQQAQAPRAAQKITSDNLPFDNSHLDPTDALFQQHEHHDEPAHDGASHRDESLMAGLTLSHNGDQDSQYAQASAAALAAEAPLNLMGKASGLFGSRKNKQANDSAPLGSESVVFNTTAFNSTITEIVKLNTTLNENATLTDMLVGEMYDARPVIAKFVKNDTTTVAPISKFEFPDELITGKFPPNATPAELEEIRKQRDRMIEQTRNATRHVSKLLSKYRRQHRLVPQHFAQDQKYLHGDLIVNRSIYRKSKVRALKVIQTASKKIHQMLYLLNALAQNTMARGQFQNGSAPAEVIAQEIQWMKKERDSAMNALKRTTLLIRSIVKVLAENQATADIARINSINLVKTGKDKQQLPRARRNSRISRKEKQRALQAAKRTEKFIQKTRWLTEAIHNQLQITHLQAVRIKQLQSKLAKQQNATNDTSDQNALAENIASQLELARLQQDRENAMGEVSKATEVILELMDRLSKQKDKELALEAQLQRALHIRDGKVGSTVAKGNSVAPPPAPTLPITIPGKSNSSNSTAASTDPKPLQKRAEVEQNPATPTRTVDPNIPMRSLPPSPPPIPITWTNASGTNVTSFNDTLALQAQISEIADVLDKENYDWHAELPPPIRPKGAFKDVLASAAKLGMKVPAPPSPPPPFNEQKRFAALVDKNMAGVDYAVLPPAVVDADPALLKQTNKVTTQTAVSLAPKPLQSNVPAAAAKPKTEQPKQAQAATPAPVATATAAESKPVAPARKPKSADSDSLQPQAAPATHKLKPAKVEFHSIFEQPPMPAEPQAPNAVEFKKTHTEVPATYGTFEPDYDF